MKSMTILIWGTRQTYGKWALLGRKLAEDFVPAYRPRRIAADHLEQQHCNGTGGGEVHRHGRVAFRARYPVIASPLLSLSWP